MVPKSQPKTEDEKKLEEPGSENTTRLQILSGGHAPDIVTLPEGASVTPPEPEPKFHWKRHALYFIGEIGHDGQPIQHLTYYGIPARDLPEGDPMLVRLTDEQVEIALKSGLYTREKPADRTNNNPADPPAED